MSAEVLRWPPLEAGSAVQKSLEGGMGENLSTERCPPNNGFALPRSRIRLDFSGLLTYTDAVQSDGLRLDGLGYPTTFDNTFKA